MARTRLHPNCPANQRTTRAIAGSKFAGRSPQRAGPGRSPATTFPGRSPGTTFPGRSPGTTFPGRSPATAYPSRWPPGSTPRRSRDRRSVGGGHPRPPPSAPRRRTLTQVVQAACWQGGAPTHGGPPATETSSRSVRIRISRRGLKSHRLQTRFTRSRWAANHAASFSARRCRRGFHPAREFEMTTLWQRARRRLGSRTSSSSQVRRGRARVPRPSLTIFRKA
jgi:hypothetical protein